jgi:hypothetical protein
MYHDQEQRDFARQLRKNPTPAENRLWHFLRGGKLGVKFRRQAAIGIYTINSAAPGLRHGDSMSFDFAIRRWMKTFGTWSAKSDVY